MAPFTSPFIIGTRGTAASACGTASAAVRWARASGAAGAEGVGEVEGGGAVTGRVIRLEKGCAQASAPGRPATRAMPDSGQLRPGAL